MILDAPATGHALGMLHSPQTFGAIARVGPIASQTRQVGELLSDPARSGYLAVALPTEMAVTEALELQDGLRQQIDRSLDAVIVNGTLPRRFSAAELARIDSLDGTGLADGSDATPGGSDPVTRSAALAARAVHDRASFQHNQLARLRRRDFEVHPVPFLFVPELDLAASNGSPDTCQSRLRHTLYVTHSGDAQAVEQSFVPAPVASDAHRQIEMHLAAKLALQFTARRHADRLDHAPPRADQDPLLGFALHPDQRPHPRQIRASRAPIRSPRRSPPRHGAAPGKCA